MLNFLPQRNKKQVAEEYFLRDMIFFLVVVFLSLFLLVILFIPSAIYSKYKNNTIKNQLEMMENTKGSNTDTVALVKKLNEMAGVLSKDNSATASDLIEKILSLKKGNISISSFSINDSATDSKTIVINGISKTRDDLTAFNKALISDGTFYSVDLPISDLIKNSDEDFSITLIYKLKQ